MTSIKLLVEKLVPGGLGLARRDGEVLLLAGALPGEEVLAEPGEMVRGVRWAVVREILSPSPFRVEPDCPLAGRCGGCDFLHVDPAAALGLKSEAALGELAEKSGINIELIESPLNSRYRSRATVHLDRKDDGSFGIGFYDDHRRLVEFDDCRLLAPELNGLIAPLRQWAAALPVEAVGAEISLLKAEKTEEPFSRNPAESLEQRHGRDGMEPLRGADSGLAVHFSPPPAPSPTGRGRRPQAAALSPALLKALADLPPLLEAWGRLSSDPAETVEDHDRFGGVMPLRGVAIFARSGERGRPRKISAGGPRRLPVAVWPELDLTLCAAPGGFTQVNPAVNKLMVKKILELAAPLAAGKNPSALDLYSGLGNIALPLLKSGFAVTAVEESPDGAAAAKENGRGLPGLTVVTGRSEQAVDQLVRQGRRFSLAVLDPPRSGARDLAPALAALGPEMIIYVACHPAVLGRDLPGLASLGYGLRNIIALDMFPRTSHLEALVVLTRP